MNETNTLENPVLIAPSVVPVLDGEAVGIAVEPEFPVFVQTETEIGVAAQKPETVQ